MTSLYAVVVVLTTAVISSTDAVAPCDQHIVELLKTSSDCYNNGNPPGLTPPAKVGTHVAISDGVLPPNNKCVSGKVDGTTVSVTLFGDNGRTDISYKVTHEPQTDYILETSSNGKKFRLYVIHNEDNVFSYYRCAEDTEGSTDNEPHMGEVVIDCNNRKEGYEAVVEKAKSCFSQIGITNVEDITPCDAELCK